MELLVLFVVRSVKSWVSYGVLNLASPSMLELCFFFFDSFILPLLTMAIP